MQGTLFFGNSNNYAVGSIITDRVSQLKKLIVKPIQNNYEINLFMYYSILPIAVSKYCRLWSNKHIHLGRASKNTPQKPRK